MQWPWQKKDGGESGRDMVRIYDFDTKQLQSIPAAELAPGMVAVRLEGIDGEVWVDASRVTPGAYQHPPFSEAVRAQLRAIETALGEVHPLTVGQWEDGFRRDRNPEPEIAYWLHLSRVYLALVQSGRVASQTLPERRAIFKLLVGCSTAPPAHVLTVTDYSPLSRAEAETVLAAFNNGGPGSHLSMRTD